ncbi:MAG: Peptidase-M28 domain-containing protein [Lachnoclostridium sp.]|jgi:hypothetical protein
MSKKLKVLFMGMGVILSVFISISSFWLPKVKQEDAPETEFSAMRAMRHIEKIAAQTHPMGSPENEMVRDYITGVLSGFGLKPQIQKTYSTNRVWGDLLSGEVENIYAIKEGTGKEKDTILMMAHYDSTCNGSGAGDDAVGVASLLEVIRILTISQPLRNNVIFLFTDGEEAGLLGAAAFVNENPLVKDIDLVINFEARGNSGPSIMFETADHNGWFMKEFKKASTRPLAYSFSYEVYKRMRNDTDFTKFKETGKSGFNFANIEGFYTYHNEEDNIDNLNKKTLQHVGENALNLVKHFGNLTLENRQSNNAVYFTVTRSVFILYSENLAIPLAVFALVLFIAGYGIGWKKKYLSIKGSLLGVIVSVLFLALSFGIGMLGKTIVEALNGIENFSFTPDQVKKLTVTGVICLTGTLIIISLMLSISYRILQRWVNIYNLLYGTLLIWLLLVIVSSILFKSASYIFVWPVIALLMGLVIISLTGKEGSKDMGTVITFIITTFICVVIFLPICCLLYISMAMLKIILPVLNVIASLPLMLVIPTGIIALRSKRNL